MSVGLIYSYGYNPYGLYSHHNLASVQSNYLYVAKGNANFGTFGTHGSFVAGGETKTAIPYAIPLNKLNITYESYKPTSTPFYANIGVQILFTTNPNATGSKRGLNMITGIDLRSIGDGTKTMEYTISDLQRSDFNVGYGNYEYAYIFVSTYGTEKNGYAIYPEIKIHQISFS